MYTQAMHRLYLLSGHESGDVYNLLCKICIVIFFNQAFHLKLEKLYLLLMFFYIEQRHSRRDKSGHLAHLPMFSFFNMGGEEAPKPLAILSHVAL
jgi:hypothetical protein